MSFKKSDNTCSPKRIIGNFKKPWTFRLTKGSKALIKVPRIIVSAKKCVGNFVYLGLISIIFNYLSNPENNFDIVELVINIDGLPFFNSASTQLWPILTKVDLGKPGVAALFCAKSKTDSIEGYLSDFLREYKHITEKGFALLEMIKSTL